MIFFAANLKFINSCNVTVDMNSEAYFFQPVNWLRLINVNSMELEGAMSDAILAQKFLEFLQSQNIDELNKIISNNFKMIWPGNIQFTELEEFYVWGAGRFQSVKNIYEKIDAVDVDGGTAVYLMGWIEGVFSNGVEFKDVRFIDRVLIVGGRVEELLVWSDLAEEKTK